MELKTARLTLLIDPNKKAAFEQLCALQDRTPSQVVRQFIRDYLAQHGVTYVASGAATDKVELGGNAEPQPSPTRRAPKGPHPKPPSKAGRRNRA